MTNEPTDYEKKLIEMQYQMKVNNELMKDCFSDLENWTKEMNEKEKNLKQNPDLVKYSTKGLPPIRTIAEPVKKRKKIKKPKSSSDEKENKQKTQQKINAYDYRKWDKLDVDKLCEEVDNKSASSSSEYTTDEEWEEEYRKTKANWEKERGNQFFKDNLLNEAVECYTKAIEYDPTNPIFLCNRAQCLIKQEKYSAAEKDCNLALTLDSKYVKALHRRATARFNLKKYDDAKLDYEELLKLDQNNKQFQNELNNVQKLIDANQLVFPVFKKEEEKSKKPLRRIKIEEINDESSEKLQIEKCKEEINQKVKLNSKEEELFNVRKKDEIKAPVSLKDSKIEEISEKFENVKLNETLKDKEDREKQNLVKENLNKTIIIPTCPSNGYQFKKDWQMLSNSLDNLAAYFKKISPPEYPKIFLNGLESDTLSKIFIIFNRYFIQDPEINLFNCLKYLSQVKRFNTQLMFLSQEDKKIIKELFDHLNGKINSNELDALKKVYES